MADELRHTIQLAVLAQIERSGRFAEHHLWVVEDGDRAVACAMMTPPFHLLVAGDDGEALGELVATVRSDGVAVPGVTGFLPEARDFATQWAGATGAATRPVMSMRDVRHDRRHPRARGGRHNARGAESGDRALLAEWAHAFARETGLREGPAEIARSVDSRAGADPGIVIWEAAGVPVTLAGATVSSPGSPASARSTRRPSTAAMATPPRSSPPGPPSSSTAACAAACSSPTSRTQRRTRSTRRSATSRWPTPPRSTSS